MTHPIRTCLTIWAVFAAVPAMADNLGHYYMSVHEQDLHNSQGTRLASMGAILQQDRANYHRFGRPGPSDEADGFFSDARLRAQIPALFAANPGNDGFANAHTYGAGRENYADFIVFICGSGGRITHLQLADADGDGYTDCEGTHTAGQ